ncbi:hypothetical protein RND71_008526 [Anisodus tanguticus]|uniref:Uncharacterized protein n=1 Tax=Anisodus tanguticus TaxID=243964 RepID=A0AAE1SPR1_9SOLA|nr:hypothetical protein RND71_008526 [Anisodus tanguticus]
MDRTKKIHCRSFEGKVPIKKLTINEARKSVPITEGVKEPHRCRPGIVTLLEICKYQKNINGYGLLNNCNDLSGRFK